MIARLQERVAPTVGIFDEPLRCYQVNEEWAAHIAGAVSTLTELSAWVGADDEQFSAIQSILQFLRGTGCFVLDCAEVEDCLDQSDIIDQIVTFNFSQQRNATPDHHTDLNTIYDGTPQSIGPSIPTTAPDQNSLHDNALCYIAEQIIASYAATKAAEISLKNGLQGWYQDLISGMRKIAPILPNWLFYLLGDELFGCVADFNDALVVLTDPDAKLDLACCLREELRGVVITQAAWDAAIATCVASLTGNAGELACLFSGDNSLTHYLSFLETYNNILVRQNAGEDFVCLCVPDGWFFVSVPWGWIEPTHSGDRTSPIFEHTNPANGELFSITVRCQSDNPSKQRFRPNPSGLGSSLITGNPLFVRPNYLLFEDSVVGNFPGADAIGWPAAQRVDIGMKNSSKQPGATLTMQWRDSPDQGHSASTLISNIRLLYKVVP